MTEKNPSISKHLNPDWLREQYIEYERSMQDIADECGVSAVAVSKAIQRFGITARPFQGRQQPGAPSETQKKITEKIIRHAPIAANIQPTPEDLRNPPLRPNPPNPESELLLRIDYGWIDPHAHWLLLTSRESTFKQLAASILAVIDQPLVDELSHFVVPHDGRPPKRARGPFWRPTVDDIIVPVVVTGKENYGNQLVGSDETPLAQAIGKGWFFWFHWNYTMNATFTIRVIEEVQGEVLVERDDVFKLLAPPRKIPFTQNKNLSVSPIDVSMRIFRALQ